MKSRSETLVLTMLVLLYATALRTPSKIQAQAPLDPAAEQIALTRFYTCEGANIETTPPCSEDVLMDADATHAMRGVPVGAWSPDGTKLLLERSGDIFVMTATGGARTNLTNHPAYDGTAAWSPDGARIAFVSDRDGPIDLYVMNADGSGVVRLVTGVESASWPTWSPDSARLAFTCVLDSTDTLDLCAINDDGSGFARLTSHPGRNDDPTWSPDSSRLAFTCILDSADNVDICAVNADGSEFARLTSEPGSDYDPHWSPDGGRILFVTSRYGGDVTAIVVMNPDGSDVTQIAPGDSPSWSSDGTRIAFVYLVPWDPDQPWLPSSFVSIINADGMGMSSLAWGRDPFWRPWAGGLNDRPVASSTFECSGLTCIFDGSPSSDSDGTIASYGWSVGDGTDSATVTHTFAGGRIYDVRLVVMDDDGALATSVQSVDLNQPPVVSFTTACNGLTCTFDGSGSSDDGTITYYSWSFGDGTYGSGATASHTYAAAGAHTVTLYATDDAYATGTQSQTVTVVNGNAPPVPSFTSACSGLTCSFNASGTSDPDGTITSYAWNFGDATTGSGATASRTYGAGGTYTVILTVTDNAGAASTLAQNVTVQPDMHVGDLDRARTVQQSMWTATVTIKVHDSSHGPVANASVNGSWNNGNTDACTTDTSGQCAVSRAGIPKNIGSVSLTITNVARAPFVYTAGDNHDPDGDSNGTTITVNKQ